MENNDAFQAEVEIDAFNSSTSTQRPLTSSTKFSASAYEAISSSGLNSEENEPLLARIKSRIDDATRVGNESENGEREPPTWSGERDFEGLPWWKTPSVGLDTQSLFSPTDTVFLRSGGFYQPSYSSQSHSVVPS